ncbi:hypothetical protein FA95DRAFT_666140 [Auriscalpium vulgare]|uniref:Uncharacterized protein n=1 Tax=Auriscalpium vulgare TaxID=40419 RepID=A0ACB8S114_9AGAM|nr:hypothetical protein FA95DRAFT_666140 [Auriscalpium vulgare]
MNTYRPLVVAYAIEGVGVSELCRRRVGLSCMYVTESACFVLTSPPSCINRAASPCPYPLWPRPSRPLFRACSERSQLFALRLSLHTLT